MEKLSEAQETHLWKDGEGPAGRRWLWESGSSRVCGKGRAGCRKTGSGFRLWVGGEKNRSRDWGKDRGDAVGGPVFAGGLGMFVRDVLLHEPRLHSLEKPPLTIYGPFWGFCSEICIFFFFFFFRLVCRPGSI